MISQSRRKTASAVYSDSLENEQAPSNCRPKQSNCRELLYFPQKYDFKQDFNRKNIVKVKGAHMLQVLVSISMKH